MNVISSLLPCFDWETSCQSSDFSLCCLAEKVADATLYIFTLIAKTALAVGSTAIRVFAWPVNLILGYVCGWEESYLGMILNPDKLNKAPEPVDLDQLALTGAEIDVSGILAEYEEIAKGVKVDFQHRLAGLTLSEQVAAKRERTATVANDKRQLAALVDLAKRTGSSDYDRMYYSTLKKVLQNIILELRRPDIDSDKKARALNAIIEAQGKCTPRRLAECIRQYGLLKNPTPEMEQLLLQYIQNLKEEIFIEAFQSSQFHILNWIRSRVGREFGLDISPLNIQDPHITAGGQPSDWQIRNAFYAEYTPRNLIEGIMTRIRFEGNVDVCSAYILGELQMQARDRGEDINDDAVAYRIVTEGASFFDGSQINARGVIFLLERIGVIIKE